MKITVEGHDFHPNWHSQHRTVPLAYRRIRQHAEECSCGDLAIHISEATPADLLASHVYRDKDCDAWDSHDPNLPHPIPVILDADDEGADE